MNAKLNAIAASAADDLKAFVIEAEDKILEAWAAAEEEAQAEETTPKLRLGFSITLNLDRGNMETKLSFGVKHTLSAASEIPDPNQASLPIGDN